MPFNSKSDETPLALIPPDVKSEIVIDPFKIWPSRLKIEFVILTGTSGIEIEGAINLPFKIGLSIEPSIAVEPFNLTLDLSNIGIIISELSEIE